MDSRTPNNGPEVAVAELQAVLDELGITADVVPDSETGADLVLPGPLFVEVKEASRPTQGQLRRWGLRSEVGATTADMDRIVVLVADRVDPELRAALEGGAWGWLERAGHLRLVAGRFHVDRQIPSLLPPSVQSPEPLRRESGLAVAIELLSLRVDSADPAGDVTVRQVARAAAVSVGSAHKALAELTELALLDEDGRPRSSLFWAVAQTWSERWFPLREEPGPQVSETLRRLLRFRLDELDAPGWAEAGDGAAAAAGAPIAAEGPIRLLVPDQRALTWALRTFGEPVEDRSARAYVAVPPTIAAVRRRTPRSPWPSVRDVVLAVELASSGPRGREALAQWRGGPRGLTDDA